MLYSSSALVQEATKNGRNFGFFMMIGSLLTAFFGIALYTRSLFLAFNYLLHLVDVYAATCLVYRIILNLHYFSVYQYTSVFVVAAISIVHFFLYFTTYFSPACKAVEGIENKLVFIHMRCRRIVLATTVVSLLSLFVTSSSPLLVVMTVDVFAGVLVLINYFTFNLLFPPALVLWAVEFENRSLLPCLRKRPPTIPTSADADAAPSSPAKQGRKKFSLTVFFGTDYVNKFLLTPAARWLAGAAFIVLVVAFLIIAIVRTNIDRQQVLCVLLF